MVISNEVKLRQSQINEIINKIKNNENIKFITRCVESGKNIYQYLTSLGLNFTDAKEIIKSLTKTDYLYTQLDKINNYIELHVFSKIICGKSTYIKIAFLKDNETIVISFHESLK